jgi:ElaB/YqjD/DUF883 family membrane-anchored ribosome-binding protein
MMANRVKDGTSEDVATTTRSRASGVREKADTARQSVSQAYSTAREKASSAYGAAREKTSAAYGTARTRASETRDRASVALDENPVAALIGGLALGAVVGALLPRSRREAELLSGVGEKINDTGRRVADAARDATKETINSYGLSGDFALDKVSSLFENATKAASLIGAAAQGAMQKQR